MEQAYDRPAVLVAELDLGRNLGESMTLDVAGHYHRPELFEFRALRTGQWPAGGG
jgi:nitrilase